MSNGFGAGFFTLTLLAGLGTVAVLLGLVGLGTAILDRWNRHAPGAARLLAVVLLVIAVSTAGFGVLVLYDESPVAVGALLGLVFLPLAVVIGRNRARHDEAWLDVLAGAAIAWSVPFIAGSVAFLWLNVAIPNVFDLAPAEARDLGVGWVAGVGAAVVAVAGTVWFHGRFRTTFPRS